MSILFSKDMREISNWKSNIEVSIIPNVDKKLFSWRVSKQNNRKYLITFDFLTSIEDKSILIVFRNKEAMLDIDGNSLLTEILQRDLPRIVIY